jgi:hypothetical protein
VLLTDGPVIILDSPGICALMLLREKRRRIDARYTELFMSKDFRIVQLLI